MKRFAMIALAALFGASFYATAGPVDDSNPSLTMPAALAATTTSFADDVGAAFATAIEPATPAAGMVSASTMNDANDNADAAVLGVRPGVARRFANFASSDLMIDANDFVAENDTRAGLGDRHGVTRSSG